MPKTKKILSNSKSYMPSFVDIVTENILNNPHCEHGPTILFKRCLNSGEIKQYYACSACRDRKFCSFYKEVDNEKPFTLKNLSAKETKMFKLHCQKYNKYLSASENIWFCTSCSVLVQKAELGKHSTCNVHHLSNKQVWLPSQILCPKSNPKCEAQYFFTDKTLQVLEESLQRLHFEKVLCVGAPRLHEIVKAREDLNINSILLDIDDRFCNFFSADEFCVYNLFTHYFFCGKRSKEIYLKFIEGSEKLLLVMDPPFGGRMELISNTLRIIEEEWRQVNKLSPNQVLPVLFIFPYFSEKTVKSHFPSLTMLEYLVDYDNHPLYTTGPKGMKQGSAVRMFTNLPPRSFPFPEEEGYSFCSACDRWVHPRNVHCIKCRDCTSKDGRTYKHCDLCGICVKPMWIHCRTCSRCLPKDHQCKTYLGRKAVAALNEARETSAPSQIPKKRKKDKFIKTKKRKTSLPQNHKEEKERNLFILKEIFEEH